MSIEYLDDRTSSIGYKSARTPIEHRASQILGFQLDPRTFEHVLCVSERSCAELHGLWVHDVDLSILRYEFT